MIPVSPVDCQDAPPAPDWQTVLQHAIGNPDRLCELLALSPADSKAIHDACAGFPLRVPLPFLQRIRRGDPRDPLLLQILPQAAELQEWPGYNADPLDESNHNPAPGLIHKYCSRVLLIATSLCAVHCRYCFRREFPYEDNRNSRIQWQQALDYIRRHEDVNEVILSGGDPLSLPDRQLAWLTGQIATIPHIRRLRLHTRLPVVIPQRINSELLDWLGNTGLQTVVVLHCNHPQEIDSDVSAAIHRLKQTGATVLNQTVLLAGVNDHEDVLTALSEALFAAGCLPYYLHALDPVRGSQHFAVDDSRAIALHKALQALLPGFLIPRLVREEAGYPSKRWLT